MINTEIGDGGDFIIFKMTGRHWQLHSDQFANLQRLWAYYNLIYFLAVSTFAFRPYRTTDYKKHRMVETKQNTQNIPRLIIYPNKSLLLFPIGHSASLSLCSVQSRSWLIPSHRLLSMCCPLECVSYPKDNFKAIKKNGKKTEMYQTSLNLKKKKKYQG